MVNSLRVNVDQGHDFQPLVDHMTKYRNFIKVEICAVSAFPFSVQLMFDQSLTNLINDFSQN